MIKETRQRGVRAVLGGLGVAFAAACISITPAGSGGEDGGDGTASASETPTCEADDADCFTENVVFLDENFDELPLTVLSAGLPETGNGPESPAVTGYPELMMASEDDPVELFTLDWSDPNGATPSFCLQICPQGMVCSAPIRCTSSLRDGFTTGTWRSYIAYSAFPAAATQYLDLTITPVASTNGEDPIGIVEDGSYADTLIYVKVGEPVTVMQMILAAGDDSEGNDGEDGGEDSDAGEVSEDESCTNSFECESGRCLSTRNCLVSVFDGACECAGTASPGVCYDITTCSSSGGVCGDGVHACCVGYSCNNGECQPSGGECPF